jgi:hypothetical protein
MLRLRQARREAPQGGLPSQAFWPSPPRRADRAKPSRAIMGV